MPTTVTMPKLSPTMEEGTIASWHKNEGDYVEAGDLLLEIATDKATLEYLALDAGFLRKIIVPDGKSANVNQPIAVFTTDKNESIEGFLKEEPKSVDVPKETVITEEVPKAAVAIGQTMAKATFHPEPPLENYTFNYPTTNENRMASSPLARSLAKEKGLDIASVKGTGPGGRIVKADLEQAQPLADFSFRASHTPTEIPGSYTEEELSPIRKIIATRLQESKSFIPHFYVNQLVNVDALVSLREQLKGVGLNVTFNDFVIKACAFALRKHPVVNSGFNSVNNTIIHFKTIDIAVAVTIDIGLITPIIRHADFKNLGEISVEMKDLGKKAKTNKLKPEEFKGGSFTVSNMGMFGVSGFSAIINPPQAAILAISGIQEQPVVKNGAVVVGKVMNITLSADHRVVDGVAGAQFIKTVQHYLENPAALLLN